MPVDEVWKTQNEEAFQAIAKDSTYERLDSQSNAGYIMYKVLESKGSTQPIYYTSEIQLYYKGSLIDGTVFDQRLFEDGEPYEATVKSFVDGFTTALQHMHPGDRWEIWIPWQLGYGSSGNSSGSTTIEPYTTLKFELEVVAVVRE